MSQPAADKDPALYAPLAQFDGETPPAPAWFDSALAVEVERRFIDVEGVPIELLAWGARGRPGLLFVHGGRAHADWWSFIAPFFAAEYRVAAVSLSGMGRSGWREGYDVEQFAREMIAGATAAGLFDAAVDPVFVCHSFGSRPTLVAAARSDIRLRAAIILDAAISAPSRPDMFTPSAPRPNHIYPTLPAALARFRLMPVQPCEHLYLLDHIARHGLKAVTSQEAADGGDGKVGWTWRFDPYLLERIKGETRNIAETSLRTATCPLAFVSGDRSAIVREANLAYTRSIAPPGTVFLTTPDAAHHLFLDQPIAIVTLLRTLLGAWAP